METVNCDYNKLNCTCDEHKDTESYQKKPFYKELLIGSGLWTMYFMGGLGVGAPTVVIPQMRNEGILITDETASWITSTLFFAGYPWIILFPILMKVIGRKKTFLFISCTSMTSFLIFVFSGDIWTIVLSFSLLSATNNAGVSFSIVCLTEYIEPKHRGVFLTMKSASYQWGIWVANAFGTFFHWKYIGITGILCSVYTFTSLIWPESPYWLADKQLYEKCEKSFLSIRGSNAKAKIELTNLLTASKRNHSLKKQRQEGSKICDKIRDLGSKEILRPMLLSIVTLTLFLSCGKLACSMYAIEILKRIFNDAPTAYTGMLILDGITVAGMYIGSFLNRVFNRRTMLLSFSATGNCFLFIIAIYLYLIRFNYLYENSIIILSFLGIFSLCISVGPMSLTTTLCGELLPLRNRSWCSIFSGIYIITLGGIIIKLSPYVFINYGVESLFLLFGCTTLVSNVILYIYLPETKGKTLRDIANYFSDNQLTSSEQPILFSRTLNR